MKYCALVLIALFPITHLSGLKENINQKPSHPLCHENPIIMDQAEHEDYQIIISHAGDHMCRTLDIIKNGELVYHDEEIGGHFYFGVDIDQGSEAFPDLFSNDVVSLVISKWTGGAHCCYSLQIFELGREFKIVANIEGGNFQPYFEDLDNDGVPEIRVTDDFLAYLFSSFAYSATAEVVLKYSQGTYRVAPELMRRPAPDLRSIDQKVRSWEKEFREINAGTYPPAEFIQTITDLYFTGHKELAKQVINWSWPSDVPGKSEFIVNYEDALKESQFYKNFEQQL